MAPAWTPAAASDLLACILASEGKPSPNWNKVVEIMKELDHVLTASAAHPTTPATGKKRPLPPRGYRAPAEDDDAEPTLTPVKKTKAVDKSKDKPKVKAKAKSKEETDEDMDEGKGQDQALDEEEDGDEKDPGKEPWDEVPQGEAADADADADAVAKNENATI
ncbi:unnamed protein product [Parascedosporium putredinis]|uniref:Uncharacterized protein n=1 Tax=Parascedosporium putredinis TaxID=1442378 RepID=A0A9P1GZ34_9PEZI|nr:unnamed protein product [Parascedosporium putredinis]CAI7990478.1 unnamed protein product [Parascedosporium putredinis]